MLLGFISLFNFFASKLYLNLEYKIIFASIFVLGLLLIIYVIKKLLKFNFNKSCFIILIYTLISLIIILGLYYRGLNIETLKNKGFIVVNCLNDFYNNHQIYPENLESLSINCSDKLGKDDFNNIRYRTAYYDSSGVQKQTYYLSMKDIFMGSDRLLYIIDKQKFEFRD